MSKISVGVNTPLSEERQKALSPSDIFDIAKKTCNVLKYPDLSKFDSIDELFEDGSSMYKYLKPEYPFDENTCILLYMSKPNFGHWCTINYTPPSAASGPRPRYDFLDPYGVSIDDQLDRINREFRKESDQEKSYLCKLLAKSEYPVHYNNKKLQKLDGKTSTCGRYAALFLKYNQVPVERFSELLQKYSKKYKIEIDDIVTAMTIFI